MSEQPKKVEPQKNRGGRWVVIGGEQYLVPPLALGTIVSMQDDVESLKSIVGNRPSAEQMQIVVRLAHAALRRNYTGMTEEEVGEMLDLGNYSDLLGAVLNISGFEKRPAGAGTGEAPASIGTGSTPA